MKTRKIISGIFILIMMMMTGCEQTPPPTPNIIIIFIDDQGYADLSCYGATDFNTPNIDRMADEGMRFTSFYVSEAVCSASRSSLLTGCYAQRVGIRGALSPFAMTGLNKDEMTIASMLKAQGYATCMVGKWHLGSRPEFYPLNYGFDEYLGIPYSNDMWPVGYDGVRITEGYKSIYPELPLIENDSVARTYETLEDQNTITRTYTERALDFIDRNADRPFFLYLAHTMVHTPLALDDRFRGSSEQGMYGDVMHEVDWSVGEIRQALKDHGLTDNTLIIYTSDNGPWLNFGQHAGSAYPLREGKGTAWEGGVRVPCLMSYPGIIPEGLETDQIASTLDLLPTIAAITGAQLPEKEIDGVNILSVMEGNTDAHPRNEFIYYYEGGLCAVRRGDWKLVLPHKYRSYEGVEPGQNGLPGPYARGTAGLELYDLKNDVGESRDVSKDHPELVAQMLIFADSVRLALGDRITGTRGNTNRSPGRIRVVKEGLAHMAKGKRYTILHQANQRYPGGSEFALTDGYLGSLEFSDESWMGFHGDNLEVVIDLDEEKEISSIAMGYLCNQASWIFGPKSIEIFSSSDNKNFTLVDREDYSDFSKDLSVVRKSYTYEGVLKARYIKLIATNIGTCPDWHPGKGENAWIFIDEIVISAAAHSSMGHRKQ